MKRFLAVALLALSVSGCASYTWTSSVPSKMRSVQVPTFRNESSLTESASLVTRQVLREFQREGTFSLMSDGAALEIQGAVTEVSTYGMETNYRIGSRYYGGTMRIVAMVSVIDKLNGRILIDNRVYVGEAPFSSGHDSTTALRDATARAADLLAQHVVDDVLKMDFNAKTEK